MMHQLLKQALLDCMVLRLEPPGLSWTLLSSEMSDSRIQRGEPHTIYKRPLARPQGSLRGLICPPLIASLALRALASAWTQGKGFTQCLIRPITALDHLLLMTAELQKPGARDTSSLHRVRKASTESLPSIKRTTCSARKVNSLVCPGAVKPWLSRA